VHAQVFVEVGRPVRAGTALSPGPPGAGEPLPEVWASGV